MLSIYFESVGNIENISSIAPAGSFSISSSDPREIPGQIGWLKGLFY